MLQGGGKGGRQNPKTKISTLTQQLKELEEELAAVEKDCAQLDEENKALLEQAQAREAEVERERAKIARAMPPPQQAPAAAASPQGAPVLSPPSPIQIIILTFTHALELYYSAHLAGLFVRSSKCTCSEIVLNVPI
jgi:TolA-binding protein